MDRICVTYTADFTEGVTGADVKSTGCSPCMVTASTCPGETRKVSVNVSGMVFFGPGVDVGQELTGLSSRDRVHGEVLYVSLRSILRSLLLIRLRCLEVEPTASFWDLHELVLEEDFELPCG